MQLKALALFGLAILIVLTTFPDQVQATTLMIGNLDNPLAGGGEGITLASDPVDDASTNIIRWGPFIIPPASKEGPGLLIQKSWDVEMLCTDCYITSMALDIIQEDGSPLNYGTIPSGRGSAGLLNLAGTDILCGFRGELVYTAANERTKLVLPPGYGYYNPPNSSWVLHIALKNFSSEAISAYVQLTASFAPGTENLKHTTAIAMDQTGCKEPPPFYTIPEGYSDDHWEWTSDRGGDLVAAIGHIHDYGISVAAENVTTGQYMCTSIAGYANNSLYAPVGPGSGVDVGHPVSYYGLEPGNPDYNGHIEHMDVCLQELSVSKGDVIRLHTQYYSPEVLDDVMGATWFYMNVTDPPACTIAMDLGLKDGILNMLFYVGTTTAAKWRLWTVIPDVGLIPIWSAFLPVIDPPGSFLVSIPRFPSLGTIGFLTALFTSEGAACFDFGTVDTGTSSSSTPSAGELQELFPRPSIALSSN